MAALMHVVIPFLLGVGVFGCIATGLWIEARGGRE